MHNVWPTSCHVTMSWHTVAILLVLYGFYSILVGLYGAWRVLWIDLSWVCGECLECSQNVQQLIPLGSLFANKVLDVIFALWRVIENMMFFLAFLDRNCNVVEYFGMWKVEREMFFWCGHIVALNDSSLCNICWLPDEWCSRSICCITVNC